MKEIEVLEMLSKTLQFVKGIKNNQNLTILGILQTEKEIGLEILLKAGREIKQTIALLKSVSIFKANMKMKFNGEI